MYKIDVYTDGACKYNPGGPGGWAYVVLINEKQVAAENGGEKRTTNQQMELTAAIKGLQTALPLFAASDDPKKNLVVHSDSAYLINCVKQKWWQKWQNNGWQTSNKKEVANQSLWKQLIPYFQELDVYWDKVAGHKGVKWNEVVDTLAVNARKEIERSSY